MIRIRTLWILAGVWIAANIVSFLIGWAPLRGMISGNLNVLFFTAVAHLVARTP